MTPDGEQRSVGRTRRLSVGQVVVDWLVPVAAIAEFIEWAVTLWQR